MSSAIRIVDLSHSLVTGMMVYPGDPSVVIEPALTVATDGVNVLSLHMGSQTGTHVDSPFHVRDDFARLDEVPLTRFYGPCVVVDATGVRSREAIPHQRFVAADPRPGDIVLVRTDWSDHFGRPEYLAHPYPGLESVTWLLERGVRTIGLDVLSLDATAEDPQATQLENHLLWSAEGGVIVENLTNLRSIDAAGAWCSVLPMNLGPSDGAPVRAVALWP